jgi:hypothetical protein
MGIKSKTRDIRTWEKHLFLDISFTNIALPQYVETRSTEIFWLSQPFPRLRFNLFVVRETFSTQMRTALRNKLQTVNRKHFFMNILCIKSFCLQKKTYNRTLLFGSTPPKARSPFWLSKPASEHAHERLLPRLSWSWTVLPPTDTHRKPVTSITSVLRPFVTYCPSLL